MVEVQSPKAGQAVQGMVTITGNTSMEGFQSAEVAFAYRGDTTNTWFLIQELGQPVTNGDLVQWDTTTITDGEYTLRLLVILQDGNSVEVSVNNLRVRNYTPIETDTPFPTSMLPLGDTPQPTFTLTPLATLVPPTATPLPPNPAQITPQDITLSLGKGALGTAAAFIVFWFFLVARKFIRRI